MSKERHGEPAFPGPRPGLRGEHEFVVTREMTTTHVGGDRAVMTTPAMIMMMETTAQEVARPFLPSDHTTVGYEVSIKHRAAAPIGTRVTVAVELLEVDGRKLLFKVEARGSDQTIGGGMHRRTIIRLGALDDRPGR